jgi:hypothetical protein
MKTDPKFGVALNSTEPLEIREEFKRTDREVKAMKVNGRIGNIKNKFALAWSSLGAIERGDAIIAHSSEDIDGL